VGILRPEGLEEGRGLSWIFDEGKEDADAVTRKEEVMERVKQIPPEAAEAIAMADSEGYLRFRYWSNWNAKHSKNFSIFVSSFLWHGELDAFPPFLESCTRIEEWPEETVGIYEEDQFPDGDLVITDNLSASANGDKVISEQLAKVLGALLEDQAQLLPLPLQNKEGNGLIEGYYLLHPLLIVSCLDMEGSHLVQNGPDSYFYRRLISDLVLQRIRVPENARIFKLAEIDELTFLREDICQLLIDAGFTGLLFEEASWSK